MDAQEQEMVHRFFEEDASFKTKTLQQARNSSLFYADANKSNEAYFEQNPLFRADVFNIVKEAYKKDFINIRKKYEPKIKQIEQELKNL